ncbi:OmpA family protein [Lutibacter sp.]|uniref:OmpA family protein n=1 Tax=Lutibacter sp. TaxID=1925666 RepID=UPI0025C0CA0F|nr:OmpA family protein [Lutibacter sp.]MCF6167271.1 OmpA family protein [Lutibacter sp.]
MLHYFKAITVFSIWVLIALTSHYFISHKLFNNCNISSENLTVTPPQKKQVSVIDKTNSTIYNFPIAFTIKQNEPYVSNTTDISYLADSIKSILTNNYAKELHIIGKYLQDEIQTNSNKNLGIQRAETVKNMLTHIGVKADRVKTFGQVSNFSFNNEKKFNNDIELTFNKIAQNSLDSIEAIISNKTLYPEFKDDMLIPTRDLEDYTKILRQFLHKYPTKKVLITGHTDNLGYFDKNLIIGLNRAKTTKKYFIDNGIKPNIISTLSKGESEPIAEKTTEKGRAKNRRIEIKIN